MKVIYVFISSSLNQLLFLLHLYLCDTLHKIMYTTADTLLINLRKNMDATTQATCRAWHATSEASWWVWNAHSDANCLVWHAPSDAACRAWHAPPDSTCCTWYTPSDAACCTWLIWSQLWGVPCIIWRKNMEWDTIITFGKVKDNGATWAWNSELQNRCLVYIGITRRAN